MHGLLFSGTDFVDNDPLKHNINIRNACLMNPDIDVLFHDIFMSVCNITNINSITTNKLIRSILFFPCYQPYSTLKYLSNTIDISLF